MEPELVYCILRSKPACDLNSSRFTMLARSSLTAAVALRTVTPQPRAPARAAQPSACRSHFLVAARRGKARRVLPGPDPPPPPPLSSGRRACSRGGGPQEQSRGQCGWRQALLGHIRCVFCGVLLPPLWLRRSNCGGVYRSTLDASRHPTLTSIQRCPWRWSVNR